MTVGLRVWSPARPLFPASLPVRVPTVESLSSALPFGSSRSRTSRLTTVALIDSVGNSHPDRNQHLPGTRPRTFLSAATDNKKAGPGRHRGSLPVPNWTMSGCCMLLRTGISAVRQRKQWLMTRRARRASRCLLERAVTEYVAADRNVRGMGGRGRLSGGLSAGLSVL